MGTARRPWPCTSLPVGPKAPKYQVTGRPVIRPPNHEPPPARYHYHPLRRWVCTRRRPAVGPAAHHHRSPLALAGTSLACRPGAGPHHTITIETILLKLLDPRAAINSRYLSALPGYQGVTDRHDGKLQVSGVDTPAVASSTTSGSPLLLLKLTAYTCHFRPSFSFSFGGVCGDRSIDGSFHG
jgi:hypothetical protein